MIHFYTCVSIICFTVFASPGKQTILWAHVALADPFGCLANIYHGNLSLSRKDPHNIFLVIKHITDVCRCTNSPPSTNTYFSLPGYCSLFPSLQCFLIYYFPQMLKWEAQKSWRCASLSRHCTFVCDLFVYQREDDLTDNSSTPSETFRVNSLTVNLNTGAYWHPSNATCPAIVVWKLHLYYVTAIGVKAVGPLDVWGYTTFVSSHLGGENTKTILKLHCGWIPSFVVGCVPIQTSSVYDALLHLR